MQMRHPWSHHSNHAHLITESYIVTSSISRQTGCMNSRIGMQRFFQSLHLWTWISPIATITCTSSKADPQTLCTQHVVPGNFCYIAFTRDTFTTFFIIHTYLCAAKHREHTSCWRCASNTMRRYSRVQMLYGKSCSYSTCLDLHSILSKF